MSIGYRHRLPPGARPPAAPYASFPHELCIAPRLSLGPDIEVAGERIGSFAAGLWDRPVTSGHFGEQAGYELYLDLLDARRLLGVPIAQLTNRLVRLDDLFGSFAGELAEQLAEARDAAARHAVAQRLLARRLIEGRAGSPELRHVLGRLPTATSN